jgi:hypothetical protein
MEWGPDCAEYIAYPSTLSSACHVSWANIEIALFNYCKQPGLDKTRIVFGFTETN